LLVLIKVPRARDIWIAIIVKKLIEPSHDLALKLRPLLS